MTKNLETLQMRLHNDIRTCLITKLFGFNLNIHSFSKVELTLYPLSVRLPKFLHVLDFTRAIYPALLHTAVFSNIPFPKPFMFLVFNVNNTDNSKYQRPDHYTYQVSVYLPSISILIVILSILIFKY